MSEHVAMWQAARVYVFINYAVATLWELSLDYCITTLLADHQAKQSQILKRALQDLKGVLKQRVWIFNSKAVYENNSIT